MKVKGLMLGDWVTGKKWREKYHSLDGTTRTTKGGITMKELSIEEKAKRYDEALDKAKAIHKAIRQDLKPVIEQIFPKLKESEESDGEKIRKHLITLFINDYGKNFNACFAGIKVKDIIAWLEKQGEQSSNILWHDVSEEPENNREIFCKWKGSGDNTWHDVVFYRTNDKTFWSGGKNQIKHIIEWAYVDDLLEKQREQKPQDKSSIKEERGDVAKGADNQFLKLITGG